MRNSGLHPRTWSLGLLLALLAAACSRPPERLNVLLVVVDTLRADKLGCYGGERGLTPELDRLASEGLLFEQASSHAPWTLPSMTSLLTSLYPQQHGTGGRLPTFRSLDPSVETLPGLFRRAGYSTAAIVNVAFLGRKFGATQHFEHLDEEHYQNNREVRAAGRTTEAALEWLADREDPFLLMVHYFDPHAVFDPPQPFRRRFAGQLDREDDTWIFGTRAHMSAMRRGELRLTEPLVRRAELLHDGEIAYTDEQIGRLLEGLADLGLEGSTLVVFTSDHGEEFLDHGGFEHGHTLYSELTHVPLILRLPGVIEPGRVARGVGHVDVAPTLCRLADVRTGRYFSGRDLLESGEAEEVPLLAHGNFWGPPLTSLRTAEYKLILNGGAPDGAPQLYRWREDPQEANDLAATHPELVQQLRGAMAERQIALGEVLLEGQAVQLSEQQRRQLETLGYLGGGDD